MLLGLPRHAVVKFCENVTVLGVVKFCENVTVLRSGYHVRNAVELFVDV